MPFSFPWTERIDGTDTVYAGDVNALAVGIQNVGDYADSTWNNRTYNSAAGSDVSIAAANTWYTGASITLPAGTYLIVGHITVLRSTTTATTYSARLSNGTAHYASAGDYRASVSNNVTTLTMATIVTLASQTTVSIQATANQTATIKAALGTNAAGNTATQISAVRL